MEAFKLERRGSVDFRRRWILSLADEVVGDVGVRAGHQEEDGQEERRNGMDNKAEEPTSYKDADVVVVDASVLIHAIGQVKAWSKYGREETIIVPLEGELLHNLNFIRVNPHNSFKHA